MSGNAGITIEGARPFWGKLGFYRISAEGSVIFLR